MKKSSLDISGRHQAAFKKAGLFLVVFTRFI